MKTQKDSEQQQQDDNDVGDNKENDKKETGREHDGDLNQVRHQDQDQDQLPDQDQLQLQDQDQAQDQDHEECTKKGSRPEKPQTRPSTSPFITTRTSADATEAAKQNVPLAASL